MKINWNIFNVKYDKCQQSAFEELAYQLFCAHFGNRIGLFRYKNQTGIETELFEKNAKYYGFQAKYYTTAISQNKNDIIDSIQKAKKKNKNLNTVFLYLNKELSESKKKSKKKPQYQFDIENAATKVGVAILWQVPSQIELQLSLPENKYIYDEFFELHYSLGNLIDGILAHNINILDPICTEILFNDKQIKINRSDLRNKIVDCIENNQNIIISGEGGSGKTALFKEFYELNCKKIPICIYKASELNITHINDLFRLKHNFSFEQFIEAYQLEKKKVFVIDSAEKLAELCNPDITINLLRKLKESGWIVMFITRYSYLNDLAFHIKESYTLSCETIDVPAITAYELEEISKEYKITLPSNLKFKDRLTNLFYLREYAQYHSDTNTYENFGEFVNFLWKKRIQNFSEQKDNIHIQRADCLICIAKERCNTSRFYINIDSFQTALLKLKQDEILAYDETHNGYFITHDIYEEWALNKIISISYANYSYELIQFFNELGESLSMRRAFRLWISERLSEDIDKVESFINEVFTNELVSQYWKDELIISILLSNYSEIFFNKFDKEIKANDFEILKRIIFLLGIACKEEDASLSKLLKNEGIDFVFSKPKGKGWEETIKFIHSNIINLYPMLSNVIPLLESWNNNTLRGETTRLAALNALYFYEKLENPKVYCDECKNRLISIIINGSMEIKEELNSIFNNVLENKWINHSDPYYELSHAVLTSNENFAICKALPEQILKLADMFWFDSQEKYLQGGLSHDIEKFYSISWESNHDYFPSSALQTPIYFLLQNSFYSTINFILNFTNKTISQYVKTNNIQESREIDVIIDDNTTIKQYLNDTIWCMYRGSGSLVTPELLQSMHMALEKHLLYIAKNAKENQEIEIIGYWLVYLIKYSRSASISAIITSIVLAYPEKFFNVAKILFRTLDFFHIDTVRQMNESQAEGLYSIGAGLNHKNHIHKKERFETCKQEHRKNNLEALFLDYQLFGIKNFTEVENTEFIETLYKIIDMHKAKILSTKSEAERSVLEILLTRMDRRNLEPKITKSADGKTKIEFTTINLPDKLRKLSEETTKKFDNTHKYTSLYLWGIFIQNKKNNTPSKSVKEFDDNPLLALDKLKELLEEQENGRGKVGLPSEHAIPGFVCSRLMIEYRNILSKDDKDFCKEIIFSYVKNMFLDTYTYQINDGVEASINVIPFLFDDYPDERDVLILLLSLSLLDKKSIGHYKRVCDYAIESIHESQIWKTKPEIANSILLAYIKLKKTYDEVYAEKQKELGRFHPVSKESIFEAIEKEMPDFSVADIKFEEGSMDYSNILKMEIIYQLIPSDTKDKIHLEIYKKSLDLILPKLLIDKREYKQEFDDTKNLYFPRLYIFKRYARFILEREMSEIDTYIQPFVDNFHFTQENTQLLEEFICAEDYTGGYEQFWHVWNKLYPKIIEKSKDPKGYYSDQIIKTYLLAFSYWNENIKEWKSLKKDNLSLYANLAKDLGYIPTVLYSIVFVLNSIASKFADEGINWLNIIISNKNLSDEDELPINTLYYMEKFMKNFVFRNRQKIKREVVLKQKILAILEFMINKGSMQGYMLRENII